MMIMSLKQLQIVLLLLLLLCTQLLDQLTRPSHAWPLSTSSRWIVDDDPSSSFSGGGERVKLACVNWPAHLEPVVAEGMGKQPLDGISKRIGAMGFNCVRLTWPLFLATNETLASTTVRQSLQSLGLVESIAGVRVNNPALLDLTLVQAFKAVVSNLAENNIMVILDNHLSKPGWCCNSFDGNGFFGDKYFNPDTWVKGLTKMATLFNGSTNVVGMSLRNELRGPRQNVTDWYRYMQMGAEAVHTANPDVLVILSGLNFDTDLSHLSKKQVELTFEGKLVFEVHWYGFSDGQAWANGNPNQVCGRVVASVMKRTGFLIDQGWPLFLSEFGFDERGTNVNDNHYLNCFLATAAELDLDWALWALPGSYYIREGVIGLEETYGVMSWDWCRARNSTLLQKVQAIQSPFQGPDVSSTISPYIILFHPSTSLCILRKSLLEPLKLGPCQESEAWIYKEEQQTIALKDKILCLKADGVGKPARLGIICSDSNSKWDLISDSKMHIASKNSDHSSYNGTLCLDIDPDSRQLITNPCKCLDGEKGCNPESQWFKMVNTTRKIASKKNFPAQFEFWKLLRNSFFDLLA